MEVYKSGGKNSDYLVTLRLADTSDSNTNLSRNVEDTLFAKYRCKKAFVISIKHKSSGQSVDCIESNYESTFIYKVGEYAVEKNYDADTSKICGKGIHFFKSKEPALYWQWYPINGPYKSWYENGQLKVECEYKCFRPEGPYKSWYENGELILECGYKDGNFEGPYKSWYENGQLRLKCEFKNAQREGLSKSWYENGQMKEECEYKNDQIKGPYKKWYENGQLERECEYKSGNFEGLCKTWYENGQLWYECEYKNEQEFSYKVWHENGQLVDM